MWGKKRSRFEKWEQFCLCDVFVYRGRWTLPLAQDWRGEEELPDPHHHTPPKTLEHHLHAPSVMKACVVHVPPHSAIVQAVLCLNLEVLSIIEAWNMFNHGVNCNCVLGRVCVCKISKNKYVWCMDLFFSKC
jgi:hypothetical protein